MSTYEAFRQEVFRLRRVLMDNFPQFAAAVLGEKTQWERSQMVPKRTKPKGKTFR